MTEIKTKDWKGYSNTVRYAQSADGKDWFMYGKKVQQKQNKRPTLKKDCWASGNELIVFPRPTMIKEPMTLTIRVAGQLGREK